MNTIISKQSFRVIILLFLFNSLMSCQKLADETIITDNDGPSAFSLMPSEEKEAYCENLKASFEYRRIGRNIFRFMPISMPALGDKRLHQVKTKAELMAWIKDNLEHTLFSSVEEAEELYKETEQLQKRLQKKFPEFNVSANSPDMVFFRDLMIKRVEEDLAIIKRNISLTKSSPCAAARDICLANADAYQNTATLICGVGGIVAACFSGGILGGIVDLVCVALVIDQANQQRQQCLQAYNSCVASSGH